MNAALVVSALVSACAAQDVRVVNLIPPALSAERYHNGEPHLAVNPRNNQQIAVSASWTHDTFCSDDAVSVLFASNDEGVTWNAVCELSHTAASWPRDLTLAFSGDGTNLFAGYLVKLPPPPATPTAPWLWHAYFAATNNFLAPVPMTVLHTRANVDQPYLQAPTQDLQRALVIGVNDATMTGGTGSTACNSGAVYMIADALVPSTLAPFCISQRFTMGATPAVRTASHASGLTYAVFYRPLSPDPLRKDVIVVRRSTFTPGPFADLKDLPALPTLDPCTSRDGQIGYRVARCRPVPLGPDGDPWFGQERRVSSNLSIAVSPVSATTVYVAWADSIDDNHQTLHVRKSINAGATWSTDLITVPNATNPALAVDQDGTVGFLYQQVSGELLYSRWETRLELSDDDFRTRKSFELANTPALAPPYAWPTAAYAPYIGDYVHLTAVNRTFYGVFSASNDVAKVVFPYGATFQRTVVAGQLQDGLGGVVEPSLDPYFFSVKKPGPPTLYATPPE
jgi:hypothetical protein